MPKNKRIWNVLDFLEVLAVRLLKPSTFQPSLGPGLDSVELNLMVQILNSKLELNREWLIEAVDSIYEIHLRNRI